MSLNEKVKLLSRADKFANFQWDKFVFSNSNATFFHRSGWQRILNDVFAHSTYFLYVESNGVIEGILPLAYVKSFIFGNSLVSLPFAVYGGAITLNQDAYVALEYRAKELAINLGVDHLELRNVDQHHDDWPTQDIYVTFRKSIFANDEENLLAIPRKQRAMIRKGIKNNLSSTVDSTIHKFFKLYSDNVLRHGTPALSKKYFVTLMDEFGSDCEILTITTSNGKPLSSVFSFYFRDEVLPYYAGDDVLARELAANDFKYWELMRRASAAGIKIFDFGRSKIGTGSYSFKKNWGFNPKPLSYEYYLLKRNSIPQNNPLNRKYKILISIWKCLPISIANLIGPFVVKNLG